MLKLRKVEIVGFKSFCERTVVTFSGSGTTCIVGPNGCGKSNVVDAISWVLGEQSHKSLRAERMADCIFNGTVKRPPLGLAEVTITMEDPELAEAARFVIEGSPAELQQGAASFAELSVNSQNVDADPNGHTEIVSLVPAQSPEHVAPESQVDAASNELASNEVASHSENSSQPEPEASSSSADRFKRRKKTSDKPV
ncbi:MAG: AAA family ATPase, partial [Acidobacteriota bacterium]|nr:AAA family ATPase [Acidobacteriota bacterium]